MTISLPAGANTLPESATWEPGIYQYEVDDDVIGGPEGLDNLQGKQFANRTAYLKGQLESINSGLSTHVAASDPHPVYATKSGVQRQTYTLSVAGGSANALTASYVPSIDTLANGLCVVVRAALANTSATPTFTPHSGTIPAKPIAKGLNQPLLAGDIAGDGHWIELIYDSTFDVWLLDNPAKQLSNNTIGEIKQFLNTFAPTGWLPLDGKTIGNAGSGAYYTGANYEDIFTHLWTVGTNANMPILTSAGSPSTRGASASADFTAGKRITLPNLLHGQALINSGDTPSDIGSISAGDVISHRHIITNNLVGVQAGSGALGYQSSGAVYSGFTGGTNNLASGLYVLSCIWSGA